MFEDNDGNTKQPYLDTVEGEIALFRSLMRSRPVGIHRYFHVLTIRNSILRDTGKSVELDELWRKLRTCYDLDILESIELDGYDPPGYYSSPSPSAAPIRSPSPSENLSLHPFFRHEFALPADESFETLISQRRMRASASLPSSSPAPSPIVINKPPKKGKSKLKTAMAGLVGGDSDSSALTQDSGDDGDHPTPRESLATGTDAGTDYAEDDEGEQWVSTPDQPPPGKIGRGRGGTGRGTRRGSGVTRGRGGGRGTKRKKK